MIAPLVNSIVARLLLEDGGFARRRCSDGRASMVAFILRYTLSAVTQR
jgi:hypothetical protein